MFKQRIKETAIYHTAAALKKGKDFQFGLDSIVIDIFPIKDADNVYHEYMIIFTDDGKVIAKKSFPSCFAAARAFAEAAWRLMNV